MQKICLFGLPQYGVLESMRKGFVATHNLPIWRRADVFTEQCYEKQFDIVVCNGLRGRYAAINETFTKHEKPVIVTDLGYIRKNPGYFQVGLGRIGWLPTFACPRDRLDKLELQINRRKEKTLKSVKKVLICGQRPDDAAHNLDEKQLINYYMGFVPRLRDMFPDVKVIWRPHPDSTLKLGGCDGTSRGDLLAELEDTDAIITYNSTTGLTGIIEGIPVICHHSAYYSELCQIDLAHKLELPSLDQVERFLSRVAYAQWTAPEMESGEAITFMLKVIGKQEPFLGQDVENGFKKTETTAPEKAKRAAPRKKTKPKDERLSDTLEEQAVEQGEESDAKNIGGDDLQSEGV